MEPKTIVACNNAECNSNKDGVCQKEVILLDGFTCFAYERQVEKEVRK